MFSQLIKYLCEYKNVFLLTFICIILIKINMAHNIILIKDTLIIYRDMSSKITFLILLFEQNLLTFVLMFAIVAL